MPLMIISPQVHYEPGALDSGGPFFNSSAALARAHLGRPLSPTFALFLESPLASCCAPLGPVSPVRLPLPGSSAVGDIVQSGDMAPSPIGRWPWGLADHSADLLASSDAGEPWMEEEVEPSRLSVQCSWQPEFDCLVL